MKKLTKKEQEQKKIVRELILLVDKVLTDRFEKEMPEGKTPKWFRDRAFNLLHEAGFDIVTAVANWYFDKLNDQTT